MSPRLIGATFAFVVGFPLLSLAGPMYDFSTLSVAESSQILAQPRRSRTPRSFWSITASAFYLNGSTWTATNLIARNESPDDVGLGVCSPNEPGATDACNVGGTGGGDYNELSQLKNNEAILLQRPVDTIWSDLFVSSLDNNDNPGGPVEMGTLYWGSSNLTGSALITALLGGSSVDFQHGNLGVGVNTGSIGSILPLNFDVTAKFMLFVPGGNVADNNDYLVYGASLRQQKEVWTRRSLSRGR